MTRVLITGAAGFIGANLARRMLRDGREVHVLTVDREINWRLGEIADDLHWHPADLRDAQAVAAIVRHVKPQWVFHLAAHGAYSWQDDMRQILETNFFGTVNLLEACAAVGVERLINTGSSSEYGFKEHAPGEDAWLEPNSHYAVSKASATLFCRHVAQSQKFPVVTLRLYSVYGPYEEPNRLMPSLVAYGLTGAYPPLVDPRVARDYVYVDDVVDAYCLAAARTTSRGACTTWEPACRPPWLKSWRFRGRSSTCTTSLLGARCQTAPGTPPPGRRIAGESGRRLVGARDSR